VPGFDANYRAGDNLFTSSAISWNPDSGVMNWYFQYTPGGMWDYDATGPHILVEDRTNGSARKLVVHAGRNGFLYALERDSGHFLFAKPHMEVTWTSGVDQHTGRPLEYDPDRDVQTYAGIVTSTGWGRGKAQKLCPSTYGGANFWPPSYSERTRLLYIPVLTGCVELTTYSFERKKKNWRGGNAEPLGRMEGSLTIADPFTGEIKAQRQMRYPIYSGALSTGGGLVFIGLLDGTFAAFDDTSFEQLWSINVGIGFAAPPMTFEADGRQYVAILSGMSAIARAQLARTPELHNQPNQTMLFVFGL
jgi:alcohol dehydrogenase (cytochrome c)